MAASTLSADEFPAQAKETESAPPREARWSLATRVAFRFAFVYFSLFCLATQVLDGLLVIPRVDIPDLASLPPVRTLVLWTAAHVFHVGEAPIYSGSGSGDKTFDWVMCFCFAVIALVAAAAWSVLDRKRQNYIVLLKWFRLFLRFALGGQMLTYGLVKIFPMQMPFPFLTRLLEPYGNFSPMGALWYSIGAAPGYERFCGSAELLAGILIMVPRTAMLGALVTAGVTAEIFILNMTFDVPVKLLAIHLVAMALVVAAPEFSRLLDFFLHDRPVTPSRQPRLFRTARANRIATVVQIVLALWLLGAGVYGTWTEWPKWGGARPKSPLYGIWNVDRAFIDGHERSPLLNDYGRWRRVIFDFPDYMNYERMDETFDGYNAKIDTKAQTIALTKDDDKKWKGMLHFQRQKQDELVVDGDLGGEKVYLQLGLVDRDKFLLVSRGFHWLQEYPFNR